MVDADYVIDVLHQHNIIYYICVTFFNLDRFIVVGCIPGIMLTPCGLMATWIWVSVGLCNGLLPNSEVLWHSSDGDLTGNAQC